MEIYDFVSQLSQETKRKIADDAVAAHKKAPRSAKPGQSAMNHISKIPLRTVIDGFIRMLPEGSFDTAEDYDALGNEIERLVFLDLFDPGNTFEAGIEAAAAYHDETVEIMKEATNVTGVDKVISRHRVDADYIRCITRKS